MGVFFAGKPLDFWYTCGLLVDYPKPRSAGFPRPKISIMVSITAFLAAFRNEISD
jgi:hypothetical protein